MKKMQKERLKQMDKDLQRAYAEVYEILKYIPISDYNKIPKDVINIFKTKRDKTHKIKINPNLPLEEQNLNRKTLVLLSVLNLDYWCDNPREREDILNIYWENEKNSDKILTFDGIKEEEVPKQELSLTLSKPENVFSRTWRKIKNIFLGIR